MKLYGVGASKIVPWRSVGGTAVAAVVAGTVILSPVWTETLGFIGVFAGSAAYVAVFGTLLTFLRIPESLALLGWARRLLPLHTRTSRKV